MPMLPQDTQLSIVSMAMDSVLLDLERAAMEREDWRGRCEPDIFVVGDRVQSQYGEEVLFGTVTQVLAPPLSGCYMIQFADGKEAIEDGSCMRLVSKVQRLYE